MKEEKFNLIKDTISKIAKNNKSKVSLELLTLLDVNPDSKPVQDFLQEMGIEVTDKPEQGMKQLSQEEELILIIRAQHGDIKARNEIIECFADWAGKRATYKYKTRFTNLDSSYDYEDLSSETIYGIIEAIRDFDITLGYRFATYALNKVNKYIYDYVYSNSSRIELPKNIVKAIFHMLRKISDYSGQYGKEPSTEKLAELTKMSVAQIKEYKNLMSLFFIRNLDVPCYESESGKNVMLDEVVEMEHANAGTDTGTGKGIAEQFVQKEEYTQLRACISELDEKDQYIINARFGISAEGETLTYVEIAETLQISLYEVNKRMNKSLQTLKDKMLQYYYPEQADT